MIAILLEILGLLESEVATAFISKEAVAASKSGSAYKTYKKYKKVSKLFDPLSKIRKYKNRLNKYLLASHKLKMARNEIGSSVYTLNEETALKEALSNLNNAQKQKALNIIRKYKKKNLLIPTYDPNYADLVSRNTRQMLNELFNLSQDNKEFHVSEGVEFATLSSSWLAFGFWRRADTINGASIGNITLTTKKGYSFVINNVPKELWFLMKNAAGKFGHWYAPKGAGSWYWNFKKNGQISTAGMEINKIRKHFSKSTTARGMLAMIFNRRS